jgi:hypothetical protein
MTKAAAALLLLFAGSAAAQPALDRELENVAAFARLYGVVRYFYPTDAAASIDWNRFAVHGVASVHDARDPRALASALETLFAPLGPGIQVGRTLPAPGPIRDTGEPLVAWRHLGPGFAGTAYASRRTQRSESAGIEELRGKPIRLRAKARVTVQGPDDGAALWLRVDRPNKAMGFFDNMSDRKIREAEWREYRIEGVVDEDAVALAFGVMAFGQATADFDALELCQPRGEDACQSLAISDPGFEAPLDSRRGWFRAGSAKNALVSQVAEAAPEGRQFLRLAPPPSAAYDGFANVMQTLGSSELFAGAPPSAGAHVDFDLGSGLRARVPLALGDAVAKGDAAREAELRSLRAALDTIGAPSGPPARNSRLADVVVAWNIFRHFYPYTAEAGVDWDARLRPQLGAARSAETRAEQRRALRGLVADARDGHGSVNDLRAPEGRAQLPIQLGLVEGRLVVTATAVPDQAPLGAVLEQLDGVPAAQRLAEAMRLTSGTEQWKRVRALAEITRGPAGTSAALVFDTGAGRREVRLEHAGTTPPPEPRPAPATEREPGLWYVDLTRIKMAELQPQLPKLATARGVIFDMRGYPGDAGAGILPHLIAEPEDDRWMHVARLVGPFGQSAGWQDFGWNVKPQAPRLTGKIVFLTDGRAISYAESVMGYVTDHKLGTIVGSATSGTNGNVAMFELPSGFRVSFTGMLVTRHDGKSQHHLVGVKPDIPMEPTLAGLRAGRDDLLERASELIRERR